MCICIVFNIVSILATLAARLPVCDVAVDHLVWLALLAQLAGRFDGRFAAVLFEVFVGHDLAADEFIFEIRVDDTGCLGRLGALADRPCADLGRVRR